MSCDRYHEEIAEAASCGPAPQLAAHLDECRACREELDARRRALALADAELRTLLASAPSPDLPTRIQRAAAAEGGRRWGSRARPFLAAAAVFLLALGALATWRTTSRRPAPDTPQRSRLGPEPSAPAWRETHQAGIPAPGPKAGAERSPRVGTVLVERAELESPPAPEQAPGTPAPAPKPQGLEVLVPPGQEEALLRFAADLQGRTVTPDSVLVADPSAPLNEPRPLHRVEIEMLTLGSPAMSGL